MTLSPGLIKFGDWVGFLGAIALSVIVAGAARTLLRKISARRGLTSVFTLWPSLSGLIIVFGFRIAVEAAPLGDRPLLWLDNVIYVFTVLLLLGLFRRAALIGIEWSGESTRPSKTLQQGFLPLLRNLITIIAFMIGSIMILQHFHYDVMSLLAALGVGSLAVGLAAKDTLSNMISGFTLIIDNNLRPGDRVSLSGTIGDVEEIGLRSTRVRLGDGNTLIVPNADLVNNRLINLSMPSLEATCGTTFRVPYNVSFARVKQLCLEILEGVSKANPRKKGWVNLSAIAEGSQQIAVGFWLNHPDDSGAALTEFHEKLLARLSSEGIPLITPEAVVRSALGGKV